MSKISQIAENNDQKNDNESQRVPIFDELFITLNNSQRESNDHNFQVNENESQISENDNESQESMINPSQYQFLGSIHWKQEYFENNIQVIESQTR